MNRFELFGEVYANVLSNYDIVSSGVFFDHQAFTDHDGVTWDLFAPFAYKPTMATQVAEAIDMSINIHRNYTSETWFRVLKVSSVFISKVSILATHIFHTCVGVPARFGTWLMIRENVNLKCDGNICESFLFAFTPSYKNKDISGRKGDTY